MTVFLQKCAAFYEFADWLASPSIMPWCGALFAVIAAVTVAPRTWLSWPRAVIRVVVVLLVWVTLAWLYRAGAAAVGDGSEAGGTSAGRQTAAAAPQLPTATVPRHATRLDASDLGQLPENCILRIGFVALESDPSLPRDFCCIVQYRNGESDGGGWAAATVRADTMSNFVAELVRQLRDIPLAERPEPMARICPFPYPGEGVLRTVQQKIQVVCAERGIDIRVEDETTE